MDVGDVNLVGHIITLKVRTLSLVSKIILGYNGNVIKSRLRRSI